ncbi:MAG: LysR substrate-binding domain-containing protein [Myxococcota bacterium]
MDEAFSPLPFTLRQLQYVLAVDEKRSFSKAAQQCRVSQPALSTQISQLEDSLDVQIFERSRRGVVVTQAGEALLEQARELLRLSGELRRKAGALRAPWAGLWRFGIIPTLAPYVLPKLSSTLRRAHPKLEIRWREATTPELVQLVSSGQLEAAVLALEAELGDLESAAIGKDPFVLAVARSHRLAGARRPVPIQELDQERLLLLEDEHCLRRQALTVCRRAEDDVEGFAATSLPTLMEMVAVGAGVTILPTVAVPAVSRDRRLKLKDFRRPIPYRTLGLAWRTSSALEPQLREVATRFAGGLDTKRSDQKDK